MQTKNVFDAFMNAEDNKKLGHDVVSGFFANIPKDPVLSDECKKLWEKAFLGQGNKEMDKRREEGLKEAQEQMQKLPPEMRQYASAMMNGVTNFVGGVMQTEDGANAMAELAANPDAFGPNGTMTMDPTALEGLGNVFAQTAQQNPGMASETVESLLGGLKNNLDPAIKKMVEEALNDPEKLQEAAKLMRGAQAMYPSNSTASMFLDPAARKAALDALDPQKQGEMVFNAAQDSTGSGNGEHVDDDMANTNSTTNGSMEDID